MQADQANHFLEEQHCKELIGEWKALLTPSQIETCVKHVAKLLNAKFVGHTRPIVLAGILKGVFMFMSDLVKELKFPHAVYFIDATSYHGEVQKQVNIISNIEPGKFKGKTVVLVDELFDNGTTMATVKNYLTDHVKVVDIYTCVLYTKKTETKTPLPDFIGFKSLPAVWLVGYGLDDDSEKRNWTFLFAKPKVGGKGRTTDDSIFDDSQYYEKTLIDIHNKVMALE